MADRPIRLIREEAVLQRVHYSPVHIWRLEKAGEFPLRVHLGANRVAWVEAEINEWIESKLKERDLKGQQ